MDHEARCMELYTAGNRPADVPDGLLVVGAQKCTLCKNTMRNNDYPTQATDGTSITWLNIDEEDGLYKFYSVPGISYDEEQNSAMAAGHRAGHTPIYLWVEGGAVARAPLASGEQPEGGIDAIVAKAKAGA